MFIYVIYKDPPELSLIFPRGSEVIDSSVEKTLLVNPVCPVRIIIEYIRKHCRLGIFTQFDLADENGCLMRLFHQPTYAYVTDQFEHKSTYFIIVFKETEKKVDVLPQLSYDNRLHFDLKMKVRKFLMGGDLSTSTVTMSKLLASPSAGRLSAHQLSKVTVKKNK
ncbi:uncharacterized protein LOC111353358 [Spodoptera litura]|uniref:Uncharacterized protein LOC111353358 n=1 Tax=Spodoptera litura TaxID=69820 RepID=A0A9J7IQC1_SPOLT|nr:uncharacterized protein LOC111353358 [Spodoptera litura]